MWTGNPFQRFAMQSMPVARDMDIIDLEGKLQSRQQLAERHHATGHDADEDRVFVRKQPGDAGGHAVEGGFDSLEGMQAVRLLQNLPRLFCADSAQGVLFFIKFKYSFQCLSDLR